MSILLNILTVVLILVSLFLILVVLAQKAKTGTAADEFRARPLLAPRRRLDETKAARKPVLRWKPIEGGATPTVERQAAE